MSKTIKITNGSVTLADYVSRKAYMLYQNGNQNGLTHDMVRDSFKVPIINIEKGFDGLVLGMVESAEIDGKKVNINADFIGSLRQEDFKKLSDYCRKVLDDGEEKKSESASSTDKA